MELEDVKTLADAAAWFQANTPPPAVRWYGLRCPRCRQRFFNSLYGTWMNYDVHYMQHLIGDLRAGGDPS